MKKGLTVYILVLVLFGLGIGLTIERGSHLKAPAMSAKAGTPVVESQVTTPIVREQPASLWSALEANLRDPLGRLFLQLIMVILATRFVGLLFARIGQPSVVGEMFAGVFLGPSLLGLLFPGCFDFIFPASSLGTLKLLSQIGVCLFMFVVGMELNLGHLRSRAQTALVVSHVGILFPYFLGVAASLVLFPRLARPGVSFLSFALFMGISLSITAFPVLARILQERRLEATPLGSTAVACAAVDDVTAWSILAVVVAIVRSTGFTATLLSLLLVVLFVALMLWVIRPNLSRWLGVQGLPGEVPSKGQVAAVLVFTFLSALSTEVIGIHALFGAFLAGVVIPANAAFREYLKVRLENFSSVFLLPLFFAFTGLRTQIGLINDLESWLLCLFIIFLATAGKLCGSMLAARLTGMNWIDSFSLGALMNTRGLMELIAINIGYDLGILSPQIFAMLVLMALVTTFMTGPLLTLAKSWRDETRVKEVC
jgi:Kef-type K+ transport system membrane component KefB